MKEIKDSGDRTRFETGDFRDMHEGKGRLDLMPLTAIIEVSKHCEQGDEEVRGAQYRQRNSAT